MKTQELAQALLARRNSMSPIILPGEMLAAIGNDAMHEALQRRWLVPNTDTGMLQVTTDMAQVLAMRETADNCPVCKQKECQCQPAAPRLESHDYSVGHASRHPNFLHELLAPATGHDSAASTPTAPAAVGTPLPPRAPTAPLPPAMQARKPGIGDSVVVAENGKTFTGTVGSVQNGRYKITFGGTEKPGGQRDYAENEVRLTQPVQ